MRQNDVLIKWTGSKRVQAPQIIQYFPSQIKTYYEPFIGGGSLLFALLESGISVERYLCSDINSTLIALWNLVKKSPFDLFDYYQKWWPFDKQKYYELRGLFNHDKDPRQFFCLLRACRNGIVRFNTKGEFNSSFHKGRQGIQPEQLESVIYNWSKRIQRVLFEVKDYKEINPEPGDFMYLDPPYVSESRFYYGEFDYDAFWKWLSERKINWLLSLNGSKSGVDKTIKVPGHLYERHILINNYHGSQVTSEDSLYIHEEAHDETNR